MRKWVLALIILITVDAIALMINGHRANVPSLSSELRHFGLACLLYAQDHGGSMPPDIKTLSDAGMLNRDVARDLSARVEYRVLKEKEPSIPPNVVVAYEAKANGAGQRSVLLMDGSVVGVPESQFTQFRPGRGDRVILSPTGALGTQKIPGN